MRTLFRYLLWFLIAALPLQGSAVASMSCSGGSMQGQLVEHRGEVIAGHGEQHLEHCSHVGGDHAVASHGKCSHCASCCVGAAAPPAVPLLALPASFATFATTEAEPAMTAYVPATLERPPRRQF